jgi:hypothetical protein
VSGPRIAAVAAVWVVATALTLLVAAKTRVGPVVARLSYRHGVHAGDVAGGIVIFAVAAALTALIVRRH